MTDLIERWRTERERRAFIALEDGTVFRGVRFGAKVDAVGELVFNTGMCGYQEILTDPSYAGQFVALTAPEIGNYGTNPDDVESRGLFLSGLVIGELNEPSNWRSTMSLDGYLKAAGKPGIYGVDTRALTEHLREQGNQKAYLGELEMENGECKIEGLRDGIAKARAWEGLDGKDYAAKVSTDKTYRSSLRQSATTNHRVVVYDFGVKSNILRSLSDCGFEVTVVPAKTSAEEVLALNPDGVFLSNGPADPAAVTYAIENIRKLLGLQPLSDASTSQPVPVMGICLGHQLLALACGAKTGRLKFGHHGCNHPIKNLATGKVEIASHNHNFAVLREGLPECLEVTHVNLNDESIAGIRHKTLPAFSVQYHPESCPGPHDSAYLFDQFRRMVLDRR